MYFAAGESVTVTPPPTIDSNGNPTALATPRMVDGVAVNRTGSRTGDLATSSNTDRRDVPVSAAQALFPQGDPIEANSSVTLADGVTWRVIGKPMVIESNFTGTNFGVLVELARVGK